MFFWYQNDYTEKMRFEVADCDFFCISAMAPWWDEFEEEFIFVVDVGFHGDGYFVVEDMLFGLNG